MATAHPESIPEEISLDAITSRIREVFERILSEVKARRDKLLTQVRKLRGEISSMNTTVIKNINELKKMKAHVKKMSVKQNIVVKKQQESIAEIESEIGNLKIGLNKRSNYGFNCNIDQLITQVKQFGEIIDSESSFNANSQLHYSKKLTAVKVIDGYKDLKFRNSIRLYIDYDKELIYVFCFGSFQDKCIDRFPITVFDSTDFTFIQEFGEEGNSVKCIATSEEFIYVDYYDPKNKLLQYRISDCSFVQGTVKFPIFNMAVTSQNQLFVLCPSGEYFKFDIYDRALNFKEEIILSIQAPKTSYVRMVQREDHFYILSHKNLLVFNRKGEITKSLFDLSTVRSGPYSSISPIHFLTKNFFINYLGEPTNPKNPNSFCLDEVGKIIVLDYGTYSIKFFSPAGDLFHTIGENTVGSDNVKGFDVVAFKGKVIVSCEDGCIRIY